MTKQLGILLGCTLAVVALAACGDDDGAPTDAGTDTGLEDAGTTTDGGTDEDADVTPTCPPGTMLCGDVCVDTGDDRDNCGTCGNVCPAGQACVDGACGVLCPSGQTECDGSCVDTMTNRSHCGGCSAPCGAGEVCSDGSCVLSCPAGQTVCGTSCVDTGSNPLHCGGCDAPCAAGQVCSGGMCTTSCATGLSECGGACVDTQYHPDHCSACDAACAGAPGATASCAGGTCRLSCDALYGDCNADLGAAGGNGCETALATDTSNCGACRRACTFANASAGCVGGGCVMMACNAGFDDCDGATANGCEADLGSDPVNCGACGTVCGSGELCIAGGCAVPVGDTCTNAVALSAGVNTVSWTAVSRDYITWSSCDTTALTGPDLVMSYTAGSTTEGVTIDIAKPGSTRWTVIASTAACGVPAPELACWSEYTATTVGGTVRLGAGETVYIYAVDTTSGSMPLSNPLTVTVTATPLTCVPGSGGVVGTTATRMSTGLTTTPTEYYVAVDESSTGYVYVGGTTTLYRVPKAGGTAEAVHTAAGLSGTQLGYAMVIAGSNIFVVNDTSTTMAGKVYRISSDGGASWSSTDYAFFPSLPAEEFRSATVYGGRIYLATEEDSAGVPTEIWSIDAAATTLPAVGALELSVPGEENCSGIARDATHYYLVCDTGSRVVRVPAGGGASEVVTTAFSTSLTVNAIHGDDTDGDGVFDVLYLQTGTEQVFYVCSPSTASPFSSTLIDLSGGTSTTSNFGLGFDAATNVLWTFDDDTREVVRVE